MSKSVRIAGSLAIATVAMAGIVACSGDSDDTASGASSAVSKVSSTPAGSSANTATDPSGAPATPATAGQGRCLDPDSRVVTDAVASLPTFNGHGFQVYKAIDTAEGSCPALMWVETHLQGATASSPERVLFFDANGYVGPATDRNTVYTQVVGTENNGVAVQFRWLNSGDISASPTGGPVTVNYTLDGGKVTADRDVPAEAFGDTLSDEEKAGTPAPDSPAPPAPEAESHCGTATIDALTTATEMQYGSNIVHPFTLENVQCSGDWARARIPARPEYGNSAMVLFHYTGGGWSAANFGSGFSCTESGTPAADAAALGCS